MRLQTDEQRERKRVYQQGWYQKNKERIKLKVQAYQKEYYAELKWEVLVQYSERDYPTCALCDEQRLPCLSIDHINNDGAERNKSHRGGVHFYRWLRKNDYPEGFQVLCMNCQFLKEHKRRTGEQYYV